MRTQRFKWLPNALTISRGVFAIPVCLAAITHAWALGFWLLFLALSTDFLDGLAAKKLHAQSKLGAELDPIADALLILGGLIGLNYTGNFPLWGTAVLVVIGFALRSKQLLWPKTGSFVVVRSFMSVACMFIGWTFIAWMYATSAFGWSWWYVFVTLTLVAATALLKRHRIRAWLARNPALDPRPAK